MLRGSIKLIYKLYLSQALTVLPESTSLAFLLIYEIQYASIFVSETAITSPFNAPILKVLSLTNFLSILGTNLMTNNSILILFIAIYGLMILFEAYGIFRYLKYEILNDSAQRISLVGFLIQKHILIIPASMAAAKGLLTNSSFESRILSCFLLILICGYNAFRIKFKVTLPHAKTSHSSSTWSEEVFDIIVLLIAVFLMRMQIDEDFNRNSSLAFSIIYLAINLLRIAKSMVFPQLRDENYQRFYILVRFVPFYALLTHILAQYPLTARFPSLVIISLMGKTFINSRKVVLDSLYGSFKNNISTFNKTIKNLALKSLYLHFLSLDKLNREMVRVIQAILENSETYDVFDDAAPIDASEYPMMTHLKPKLLKFIEVEYAAIVAETSVPDSFQIRLSQLQFLVVACRNPMKAMLYLCETKKVMKEMLSTEQEATLEWLEEVFRKEFKSEVSLDEVLNIHEAYDALLERTENLVKTRAQIFTKLGEPACDLFAIKSLGMEFAHGIDEISKEIRKLIKEDCIHLGILHLYEYIQTILYEKSVEFEISMAHEALIKAKNMIYTDDSPPDRKVFANIDQDSTLFYMAFSLDRKNFGRGIACSKNAQKILGTAENTLFKNLTIDDVFPKFFAQRVREVMQDYLDSGVGNYKDLWCKVWICQADGSICEARAFLAVDLLYQSDLSLIVYIFPNRDSQNYILCDSNLNLIGLSAGLVEHVRKAANKKKVDLLARIENAGIIQDIIPTFELALSTNKEFEGLILFDKVLTLMTQRRSKSIVEGKKPSIIEPAKFELTRMAKFTVIFEQLDVFEIGFCKVIIGQIDDRPNHHKKASITSTRVPAMSHGRGLLLSLDTPGSADQHWDHKLSGLTLPLATAEGPSKINPVSCDVTALETPGEIDKSEEAELQKEEYLDYRDSRANEGSRTSHFNFTKKKEEIFDRNSSHSSSRLSIRRRRMKMLISKLDVPNFLMVVNVSGHLAVVLLVVLAIISSVLIDQGYNRFSQFAGVAPFPSYFISAVESIFGSMETMISINRNFYPSQTAAADLQESITANFLQKIERFITAYDKYMVNFNVPSISPNFKWSDYDMNSTELEIGASGTTLSIYEVSRRFMADARKLSLTSFDQITTNNLEVIQLRQQIESMLNTYENMRTNLFTGFYSQYDDIIRIFDIVLIIGVVATMVLIVAFIWVFRAIEIRKFELMKQLMTIPTNLIDAGLLRLQTEYELYFGVKIPITLTENSSNVTDKKKSSGNKNSLNKRKIVKTNETSLLAVSLWMLIPAIYVLSYYAITNIYFKKKTDQTIPFIKNIDMLSRAIHYPGYSLGLMTQLTNLYDSPESLEAQTVLAEEILAKYREINIQMVEMMQTASGTFLASSEASEELKERYLNISGVGVCDDIITYPNYKDCFTAFQNAADLGFASTSRKLYEYVSATQAKFLANPSLETVLEIYADPAINDRAAISLQVDSTVIENMEVGTSNLTGIIGRLQEALIIFMVVGIIQMSSVLFLMWRPFNRRITSQYLDCRRVFAILPIDMISENRSIMYILKKQDNTQFGF